MNDIKVTKRGNIKVDGVKYYAVPWADHPSTDCRACAIFTHNTLSSCCNELHCNSSERPDTYRLPNQHVRFVTSDEYAAIKASVKSTKEAL